MQDMETQGPGIVFWVVWALVILFYLATMWKVYEKAGKPGWAAIVPIYNTIVLLQIGGKPVWWILLFLVPLVNIVIAIIMHIGVARGFGKGVGFGWGLALLGFIFFPILAWGDAEYQGPPS
jgi:Family of unknown function (DUF5684)